MKKMTTAAGRPVLNNQNSITAGKRGPVALQSYWLIEKLAHFDRERIPERVVHAKGSGAFGTFKVTHDISKYSCANVFNAIGKETPVLLRFSTVAGEKGAADAERDVRGFALKFYTEEGNWDLTGNNTPVFFIRDPLKFPDFIHTQKRDPKTNLRSGTAAWDFWSGHPESLHQVTILMSDRGLPKNYRQINGYGSHTYSLINDKQERVFVKFHFKTQQGHSFYTDEEAVDVVGQNRETAQADLFQSIESGDYPRWAVKIQIMTEEEAKNCSFNPFDLTKVWPHGDYPLIDVGTLELNENPENYFASIEQAAFNPANVVSGIGFSPDKMLQGRLFAYGDTQRYRLGVNHNLLPVNKPRCPYHSFHRDGSMRADDNLGGERNYEPSIFDGEPLNGHEEPELEFTGNIGRFDHREDEDYYTQPGNLFRLFDAEQKERLYANIARSMDGVPEDIQKRQIEHFAKADPEYGAGVAKALGLA